MEPKKVKIRLFHGHYLETIQLTIDLIRFIIVINTKERGDYTYVV
jgi:hypothetical protein